MVIRKQTEVDSRGGDDDVDEADKNESKNKATSANLEEQGNNVRTIDINHELYGWGRGYHGQLGLKDLKVVQWVPKKIKIKKDPRLKEEDQPTRFAMISCGEKHTVVLAVNGKLWWTGEKVAIGLVDPNKARKNKFEKNDESTSFQKSFT